MNTSLHPPTFLVQCIQDLQRACDSMPSVSTLEDILQNSDRSRSGSLIHQDALRVHGELFESGELIKDVLVMHKTALLKQFSDLLQALPNLSPEDLGQLDAYRWALDLRSAGLQSEASQEVLAWVRPPHQQLWAIALKNLDVFSLWAKWQGVWDISPTQALSWLPWVEQYSQDPDMKPKALSRSLGETVVRSITHPNEVREGFTHNHYCEKLIDHGATYNWRAINIAPLFVKPGQNVLDEPNQVGQRLRQLWSKDPSSCEVLICSLPVSSAQRTGYANHAWHPLALSWVHELSQTHTLSGEKLMQVCVKMDATDPNPKHQSSWQLMLSGVCNSLWKDHLITDQFTAPARKI